MKKNLDVRYFAPLVRSIAELEDAIKLAGEKSELSGAPVSIFQAPNLELIVTQEPIKTLPLVATVEFTEDDLGYRAAELAEDSVSLPPPDEIEPDAFGI